MTEKTEFQAKVFKKYGVIPVFDGQPEYVNVKTSVPGETFNQWCFRVLGREAKEVRVMSLVDATPKRGNARIGGLAGDIEYLKKIIRFESRRSYQAGMLKAALEEDKEIQNPALSAMPQPVGRDLLYDSMADLVPNRTLAVDEFFDRFSKDHSGESSWVDLFEILAKKYAELADSKRGPLGNGPDASSD